MDKKPKSKFSQLAKDFCDVKYLENGVRDPRAYIDEKKIMSFRDELDKFAQCLTCLRCKLNTQKHL